MTLSVDASSNDDSAQTLVQRGFYNVETASWQAAKQSFAEAAKISPANSWLAAECYSAAGDAAEDTATARICHREAKRWYKRLCSRPPVPSLPPPAAIWCGLGAEYAKLSDTKGYCAHDINKAITSFEQALAQPHDDRDVTWAHAGRLQALTDWLAHPRRAQWLPRRRRQTDQRQQQAWADLATLLRAARHTEGTAPLWLAAADLSTVAACISQSTWQ